MSMEKFTVGQTFEKEWVISKEETTNRMGKEGADVLSTPALLGLMENTCIQQSEPYIPDITPEADIEPRYVCFRG